MDCLRKNDRPFDHEMIVVVGSVLYHQASDGRRSVGYSLACCSPHLQAAASTFSISIISRYHMQVPGDSDTTLSSSDRDEAISCD